MERLGIRRTEFRINGNRWTVGRRAKKTDRQISGNAPVEKSRGLADGCTGPIYELLGCQTCQRRNRVTGNNCVWLKRPVARGNNIVQMIDPKELLARGSPA